MRMWRKMNFCVLFWWECKLVRSLWKTVWRFPQKSKLELPYDPAFPLLDIYPKEIKTVSQRDICTPMFIAPLLTIAKIQKVSINGWMDKEDTHTHRNIQPWERRQSCYLGHMDEPSGHYAKWNKLDTERQILYNLACMWNVKKLN